MAKKVEKLKKLYAQNGGSLADVAHIKRTGDMIDALAALEIGGGGNNDFVVNYSSDDGETYTADKTFADISAAYSAGKNIKAKHTADGVDMWYSLCGFAIAANGGEVIFSSIVERMSFTLEHRSEDGTETITLTDNTFATAAD